MPVIADQPDPPEPAPKIPIRVTVPEEFMGMALGEINACGGYIIGTELTRGRHVIDATLPENQLEGLSSALLSATPAAKVERRDA